MNNPVKNLDVVELEAQTNKEYTFYLYIQTSKLQLTKLKVHML